MLVKNWVGEDIVDVDDGTQTMQVWWEKSLQRRSTSQQKKNNGHLDVFDMEYLETA
jgi:hypothetical protein